jgi:AcrR family transcriptional regulator
MAKKMNMEQRKKIIKISFALFIEDGYEKVTTRTIAEKCGMQRALLHHYYNKKEKILLEVYIIITTKLIGFLRKNLSKEQMDLLVLGAFFRVYYEMMSIKPLYANIYMSIYENAKLLNTMIKYSFKIYRDYGWEKPFAEEKRLGLFMLAGSFSQMVLLYYNGDLTMTSHEVINYTMERFYLSKGLSPKEARRRIDLVDSLVTKEYVQDFIACLEHEMHYTGKP